MTWSIAFAKQAKADLEARDWLLQSRTLPECHELHFLQMACEKLCKAHLMSRPGADSLALQKSHAYVAKNLPINVRQEFAERSGHLPKGSHVIDAIRRLAEQIERLAPANDAGGTAPSNCEYPWTDAAGQIVVPAEHSFRLSLLYQRAGVTLIKIMRVVANRLIDPTP